jgi:hypothetical protein
MGGPPSDEPPVKGGQNEALSRTYSEMARYFEPSLLESQNGVKWLQLVW